jgi:hypothetical protein
MFYCLLLLNIQTLYCVMIVEVAQVVPRAFTKIMTNINSLMIFLFYHSYYLD